MLKNKFVTAIKLFWVSIYIILLAFFIIEINLFSTNHEIGPEARVFLAYYLIVISTLSFPVGYICWFLLQFIILAILVPFFSIDLLTEILLTGISVSILCFVMGYIQWFILIPSAYKKYISKRIKDKGTDKNIKSRGQRT